MAPPAGTPPPTRLISLDILRGVVMVLMAIDHVRVYAGVEPGGPTPGVFFTRWVTHFCAPIFIFLAGTGAYLYGRTHGGPAAAAKFLAIRGAWLVLLELTILRIGWTFNLDFGSYLLAGVIWVIGWCMILMALLVWLPARVVGAIGVAVIVGHNAVMGPVAGQLPGWLGQLLYFGGPIELGQGGPTLAVLYVIVPWIGVMAAGYGFGLIMELPAERRRKACLGLGVAAVAAFLVLRGFNLYGDPRPWGAGPDGMPALLQFLNTAKYPASLLFLLMTLGPMLLVLPAAEGARGGIARALTTFGRVPFFFYVLHIPLIHAAALLVSVIRTGSVDPWLFTNHPMMNPPPPDGYVWTLALLYLVWAVVIAILYLACRRFAAVKARSTNPWLRYL